MLKVVHMHEVHAGGIDDVARGPREGLARQVVACASQRQCEEPSGYMLRSEEMDSHMGVGG